MKNLFTILLFSGISFLSAQVAIGKETVDGDGLLDFKSGTTNGIILPMVNQLPLAPANGTILMDQNDLKIKIYENDQWTMLTDAGSIHQHNVNTSEETEQKIIIGSAESIADGIVVLESDDKALILPKIENPHLHVKSPHPGMICYDTASNSLAVFDGLVWSYWK